MSLEIYTSTIADGSMLNRDNPDDQLVFSNRLEFLKNRDIDIYKTVRVRIAYNEGDDFCRYREVMLSDLGDGMLGHGKIAADALVTKQANCALFLPIADCLAAVIYDPNKEILMLSHLGRQSTEQNGGVKSIKFLVDNYNCNPAKLTVWLSPAASRGNYPLFAFNGRSMKEVITGQMISVGVLEANIKTSSIDTTTDLNCFSHSQFLKGNRPVDGRFAVVAMMRK